MNKLRGSGVPLDYFSSLPADEFDMSACSQIKYKNFHRQHQRYRSCHSSFNLTINSGDVTVKIAKLKMISSMATTIGPHRHW